MTSRSRAADERDSATTLIARARHGDERAVELLLNRHVDRVHAIRRRLLGNPENALDATQEALIAIARGIVAFDGRSAFTTRLYRVATNAALDDGRRVALVLVAVGVFAVMGRDGGETGTAGRAHAPKGATPGANGTSPDSASSAEAAAGIRDLGDLGDVSDTAQRRRQVRARLDEPPESARATAPPCLARAAAANPPPSAYGTGIHLGRSVLVLVLPARNDRSMVVLLATRGCRAVAVSDLS